MRENKSPWLHNFNYERKVQQLKGSVFADVAILGGGISGVVTAYEILENTNKKVCLIEGDLVAHGATGHNAGYVEAEFEKPFKEIVKEYGLDVARSGKYELDSAWEYFFEIWDKLNLGTISKSKSHKAYSNKESFIDAIQEEYLKYGKLDKKIYLDDHDNWMNEIPENYKEYIEKINCDELKNLLEISHNDDGYRGIIVDDIVVGNSALFTEELVKYCLKKYSDRFQVFEKSFVNSIRLLQNTNTILDSLYGVCICDKVVLCTNGFENFNIYGPLGRQVSADFHHNVSGLIGYMMATFISEKEEERIGLNRGGKFYKGDKKKNVNLLDVEPYIYYTNRKFRYEVLGGGLLSLGGPDVRLRDRKVYKKDHEFDEKIYSDLEAFQKDTFNISENPIFKWHGLMGYTKTNIRMVGQDKRFLDLFYNLGCNGIGIIPSVAGAKRIAKLISGERLPKSIFDPR